VRVTAADGTVKTYTATVYVTPLSSNTSLSVFTVAGQNATNGATITLNKGTTSAGVIATPADAGATTNISGNNSLIEGNNTIRVRVTAEDGTVADYVVTAYVTPKSTDNSLSVFTVNGSNASNNSVISVAYGTTSVTVVATPSYNGASVQILGATGLTPGNNQLSVRVTSESGVLRTYSVTIVVTIPNDTSLAVLRLNGKNVTNGTRISVASGTDLVDVTAIASDSWADVQVDGDTGLNTGSNTIVITVTALSGASRVYYLYVTVLQSKDTSLFAFTVNGDDVVDGSVYNVAAGTTSVEIVADPNDPDASASINGAGKLVAGDNAVTVRVTAPDGTIRIYKLTIHVAQANDASLATFTVAGQVAANGSTITVATGTNAVAVVASPVDQAAVVSVTGRSGLHSGNNTLTVVVTAADGTTKRTYTVTVYVTPVSTVTTLSNITINSNAVVAGGSVNVPSGTTSVSVAATTTDAGASYVVSGRTGLRTGSNTVTITVTAADGITTANYTVTVVVAALSSNTNLATFTINGTAATNGSVVTVANGTSMVSVIAIAEDAGASLSINGRTGLHAGNNTLTVAVVAADGTVRNYSVTVIVQALSADTSLAIFNVNGQAATSGSTINLSDGTVAVGVVASATDAGATVAISGRTGLVSGNNTLRVTVTAADSTVKVYTVTLNVSSLSSDTSLSVFKVNNQNAISGSTVTLAAGTTSVSVVATSTDMGATVAITGRTGLVSGSNSLRVRVTAANSDVRDYTVNVVVATLSTNTELSTFTVAGVGVSDGASLTLPAGTTSVAVVATAVDPDASVSITGRTNLVTGANTIRVTVTAASGAIRVYLITANVTFLSNNTSLSAFSVNGSTVTDGSTVNLANGTTRVTVIATTSDASASASISGRSNLITGTNLLTVAVTAADGTLRTYRVTLLVAGLSNDTSLASIKVNGVAVLENGSITVAPGTTSVTVVALPNDSAAGVSITGRSGLMVGNNVVDIAVTAPDGTVDSRKFTVIVSAASNNTSLSVFSVNGADLNDGSTVNLAAGTTSVAVVATRSDSEASVWVSGATGLNAGTNKLKVVVTSPSGQSRTYNVSLVVAAMSSNTNLTSLLVAGQVVSDNGSVNFAAGTNTVPVSATAEDAKARVLISGRTNLVAGANDVVVTVTAENGNVRTYHVTLNVAALSANTALSAFTVNGVNVTDGSSIDLPAGTTAVSVVATRADSEASGYITGSTGLHAGANTLTAAVISASGITKTYKVTLNVAALSNNTNLSTFTISGTPVVNSGSIRVVTTPVVDGSTVYVANGTGSVRVVATAEDSNASVSVIGRTNLSVGNNNVAVTVTAADGTVRNYTVKVVVASLSNDTSLKSLTVNGVSVAESGSVTVENGVTRVPVVAVPNEAGASIAITGRTNLVTGSNKISITITASDGTVRVATVNVTVRDISTDASLSTFTVSGTAVVDGSVVTAPAGTTRVRVRATTNDPTASVGIIGKSGLVAGNNIVKVVVTAADGSTATYRVTVVVPQLVGVSLASRRYVAVAPAVQPIVLAASNVSVSHLPVKTIAPIKASVAAGGSTGSSSGSFKAAETFSNDKSLSTFTIAGQSVSDGSTITVAPGTTFASVVATPTDPFASAKVSGNSGLHSGNNTVTVVVTADDDTEKTYTVTVLVATLSSVKSLSAFAISDIAVASGDTIHVIHNTNAVTVVAVPTDSTATAVISGSTTLTAGNNTVTVVVTAEDASTATYSVTVVVDPISSDTSLSMLKVFGTSLVTGSSIDAPPGTTRVSVSAVATDPGATVLVTGFDNLHSGANSVNVKVTAADGTVANYSITVNVRSLSSIKTLSTFTVNGTSVSNGSTLTAPSGTNAVGVVAVATSAAARVSIAGASGMTGGANTVTVTITAEDGTTSVQTVTVNVIAFSSVKTLSSIVVNGFTVIPGAVIDLPPLTARATVVALTTDGKATVFVSGNTNMVSGRNTVTILVTAEDGSTATYTVTLNVTALSNVNTLSLFSVLGNTVVNGSLVDLPPGTKTVVVVAKPTDSRATVEIIGNTNMTVGSNTASVIVTAEDGTKATYTVVFRVAAFSTNKNLSVFKVNGSTTTDGATILLAPGSSAVEVTATPEDSAATVAIAGKIGLHSGDNTLTVTVTAADSSTKIYSVKLVVPTLSSNTNLAIFTINATDAVDGSRVSLAPGTTRVSVVASTADVNAALAISGNTNLKTGDNPLTVTVTAADGTVKVYRVTLAVTAANGTGLSTFTANGSAVVDGAIVNLNPGTTSITIVATPADLALGATSAISGNTGLVAGLNTVTVVVTAGDATTKQNYTLRVNVASLSSVNTLSTFTINGSAATDRSSVNLPAGTASVSVVALPTDSNASVLVAGRSALRGGNNTLTVTVTAVDGSVKTYTVTLNVNVLSSDKTLKTLTVNGVATSTGSTINLPAATSAVNVAATANDSDAAVTYSGANGLRVGNNTLTITVTAADASSTSYTVTLVVAALSTDKTLSTFTINGTTVSDGGVVTLAAGTQAVSVVAIPNDVNSTATITGRSGLVTGSNTVSVAVTSQDGSTKTYSVTANVAALSSIKTLSVFTVNDAATSSGSTITLPAGTAAVTVVATPTDSNAIVSISGKTGLSAGNNTLTVVVTAENGTTATYLVTLKVLELSGDTTIKTITINDTTLVQVGGTYNVAPGIATVDTIRVATNDPTAQALVSGNTNLINGRNTVNIRVTAQNGTVANYTFTIVVNLASNDATLKTLTINGQQIVVNGVRVINSKITVDETSNDLNVSAISNDPAANVEIDGDLGLINGIDSTLMITVTSTDGTVKTYKVLVHVKGNTSIETLQINSDDVAPGETYHLVFGTKSYSVTAIATDSTSKTTITRPALVTGNNVLTIKVTSRDNLEKIYTVNVQVDNDTSLKIFQFGTTVLRAGDTIQVAYGTKSVNITATPTDSNSTVSFINNANFAVGNNVVTVRVTGKDATFTESAIIVAVAAPSSDNTLSAFTLNSKTVRDGDTVTVPTAVTSAAVVATPTDSHATVLVTGDTGLHAGSNTLTVKITAENGTIATKTITILVAANNDQWLLVSTDPAAAVGVIIATEDKLTVPATDASTASQFVASATTWSVAWTPYWLTNLPANLDATKHLVIASGASATLAATGFAPNSEARVYLGTNLIGTFTASAAGAITGSVPVANTNKPGNYTLTVSGFTTNYTARWVAVRITIKPGYATKVITAAFVGAAATVPAAATKLLATLPKLLKGMTLISITINGWAAGAKVTAPLTALGKKRAAALQKALVALLKKAKLTANYTLGFGGLEKAKAKTSRGVVTILYAKP
jgi:hypothetical protein